MFWQLLVKSYDPKSEIRGGRGTAGVGRAGAAVAQTRALSVTPEDVIHEYQGALGEIILQQKLFSDPNSLPAPSNGDWPQFPPQSQSARISISTHRSGMYHQRVCGAPATQPEISLDLGAR